MAFLSQVLAVEKTVKSSAYAALSNWYKIVQKAEPFSGIERTYQPHTEEGEILPRESKHVQVTGQDVLDTVAHDLRKLFDVTADKDFANQNARADVVVDGQTILEGIPVTYLLFLEKQLTDLRTFVAKIPTQDPAQEWVPADQPGVYRSARPVTTVRTQKVPRALVMYPATDKHPAQVQPYNEDVAVGTWTKVDFTGALPAARSAEILERIDTLALAVKFAREEGNKTEVPRQAVASKVFGYLFS